jgi:hypothetical protein
MQRLNGRGNLLKLKNPEVLSVTIKKKWRNKNMKKAAFVASTDLEIGDKVRLVDIPDLNADENPTIYDIRCIHYLRENKVEFEFQVICEDYKFPWLTRDKIIRI